MKGRSCGDRTNNASGTEGEIREETSTDLREHRVNDNSDRPRVNSIVVSDSSGMKNDLEKRVESQLAKEEKGKKGDELTSGATVFEREERLGSVFRELSEVRGDYSQY